MDQLKTAIREKGIAVEELCQYSYDTNRNQTDIKNTKTGEDQTYVYDAENRLSQVSMTKDGKTAVIQQNIYNGEGQRIQKVDGDETTNYYYQNGVVAYTTDANGEQNSQNLIGTDGNVLATERFQQNATQYYLYNKDIQESTSSLVKEDGSADATYQYTDFGETTIHDGVVAYTTDADGNQNSQNLIGTEGNVLATERFKGDDTQYYLYNKDIQGSTTSLVKEDGSADATYQYTDYGETIIHGDDQAKNEVCYTGGIYDQSTGLYYLNARYYNPEDGRFMTEDTYRGDTTKSETGHLYVYCANNPVNYVDPSGHFLVSTAVLVGVGVGGIVGAIAGSYKGRLVAKRLGYKGKKRNLFIATYGIKGAVVGAIIGVFAGYGIGVAMGASSSSGLAVKGVNSAIRRVASDQNKVRHIMQSKHEWTKVTKKNQWKYVKPIVKKEMKSGKMEAIGKTKGKEIVYKFVYNYKEKIIEGTCIAKKGVVKLSDAWVKTIGL